MKKSGKQLPSREEVVAMMSNGGVLAMTADRWLKAEGEKRITSNNPLFRKMRLLEHEALAAGIISKRGTALTQAIDLHNHNLGVGKK